MVVHNYEDINMKNSHFALPLMVRAHDDSSTLLSLKLHPHRIGDGLDHLLDVVGSRNVTQMSFLLRILLSKSCGKHCDGMEHKESRTDLLWLYKKHITAGQNLDRFVWEFSADCNKAPKEYCLLSHTTWNCGGLRGTTIGNYDVDAYFGGWLSGRMMKCQTAYERWTEMYKDCKVKYEEYVEQDANCDCEQAMCETVNCAWDSCHFNNCEDSYQSCWASCDGEKIRMEKEKIECYVTVLAPITAVASVNNLECLSCFYGAA